MHRLLDIETRSSENPMARGFSSQMARNIFYGGTLFFVLLFAVLIFDTESRIPERSNAAELTPAVVRGKHLWETRNCIGCHTLLGEGAYFAPELGNVYTRRGPEFIKAWIKAQPTHVPGRRQMPQFNFTEAQLQDLVEFLKWTSRVDTEKWPPNIEG
jgi:nitric oxide reductase subunit C